MNKLDVLIIEDSKEDYELYSRTLKKIFDCNIYHVDYAAEGVRKLEKNY